ncbi:MAG: helix-turn-helix transcriptional regulator [Deltaproteobacteria bacterium]|nr:helix-turn-helix transcriptional regulator [Deltaproteobacteria bacterium]
MKTLGEYIRELREEKDLSLRELAKKLKISAPFLSDIELGHRYPSDKVLGGLARILDIPLKDLKAYDTRPPVKDLKRMAAAEPLYGVAFRKVVNDKISAKKLLELIEEISAPSKKK